MTFARNTTSSTSSSSSSSTSTSMFGTLFTPSPVLKEEEKDEMEEEEGKRADMSFLDFVDKTQKCIKDKEYQKQITKSEQSQIRYLAQLKEKRSTVISCYEKRIEQLEKSNFEFVGFALGYIGQTNKQIENINKEYAEKFKRLENQSMEREKKLIEDHRDRACVLIELDKQYENLKGERLEGLDDQELNHLIETNQKKNGNTQKREQDLVDQSLCAVCSEEPIKIILKPCQHFCLCRGCATKVSTCPICRQNIAKKKEIFS
ncbi:hypothetical protein DFA_07770 [Cavenderia fasciculata]|uniref:RING-type domain-containing protein n=1 Tax=Cavenderia fasciculata TaxID=261658 RepID=F4Q370_CACFS|nr:uncharacterized protein DFA_07770 [Cavenderia fasciculata]EGG16792.1 hypothetical protein DFA_07770 [Cavenderia fasciculata]|eukprot:XP_004355266.1 hypothetical protein DFA_07770 [Cavenderia fasciculata]